MSTQIAIRLPDEAVAYLDAQMADGAAESRADFIWHAILREQRRLAAERDAATYASSEPDDEMDAIVARTSRTPMPDLD